MDQVLPMVKHNLGLGFYSETLAAESIVRGEVFHIRLVEPIPEREINLVEDISRPQRMAVQALVRLIKS